MQNVTVTVKGNIATITVDLSQAAEIRAYLAANPDKAV